MTQRVPLAYFRFSLNSVLIMLFEPVDHTINAPMLEDLSFSACDETIFYFNIKAPKLCTLTIKSCFYGQKIGNLPVNSSFLGNARILVLDPYSIKKGEAATAT